MNEAIKLAIEQGGYKLFGLVNKPLFKYEIDYVETYLGFKRWIVFASWPGRNHQTQIMKISQEVYFSDIVQDSLFWQALGKALGWGRKGMKTTANDRTWLHYAHQYFDLVLTGGETEKFWKQLIANH